MSSLDDLEPGLVGECVKELDRSVRPPIVGSYGHKVNLSRKVVVSMLTEDYLLPADLVIEKFLLPRMPRTAELLGSARMQGSRR